MNIGKIIQKERKKKMLTQEELAKHFNVTRQTVSSWENERTYPDLITLVALSDFFEITLDYLLREDDKMIKDIDLKVKKNRDKNIMIFMLCFLIFILFNVLYFTDKELQESSYSIAPLKKIESIHVDLNGEDINPNTAIHVKLIPNNNLQHISLKYLDDTIYVAILQNNAVFKSTDNSYRTLEDIPQNKHYSKIVLVSIPDDPSNFSDENCLNTKEKRIIYEN